MAEAQPTGEHGAASEVASPVRGGRGTLQLFPRPAHRGEPGLLATNIPYPTPFSKAFASDSFATLSNGFLHFLAVVLTAGLWLRVITRSANLA